MKRRPRLSRRDFPLLGQLWAVARDRGDGKPLRPQGICQISRTKVKVPLEDLPVDELVLGPEGKRLQVHVERPLRSPPPSGTHPRLVVLDPAQYQIGIGGFLLLGPGMRLALGRGDRAQQALLALPRQLKLCHFLIRHAGDGVVLHNFSRHGASLAPIEDQMRSHRLGVVERLARLLAGLRTPLPPPAALALLQRVNALMATEAYRPSDPRGLPGGPCPPYHLVPILVADLHARVDNLLSLLTQNCFLDALERGSAYLLLLGDAVHSEDLDRLADMEESMRLMDIYFSLKTQYPSRVFYLRGNHDAFGAEIVKEGVPQGRLWAKALEETRGPAYREAMDAFYQRLPYLAVSGDFIACHGGRPEPKVTRQMLVEVARFPELIQELITNRLRRPGNPQGYTRGHIQALREALGLTPNAAFIVGHTPLDRQDNLWPDAGGIPGHHILFSAGSAEVGVITRVNGHLVSLRYPVEPLGDELFASEAPVPNAPAIPDPEGGARSSEVSRDDPSLR